ncbi:MAG: zinc ribbon domain-containing protein [Elusimicrobiota bacterium]|nr:zinc ribbon domain-containing protein [Endomicrobiia bacterium]MDW8165591.1 zinc ribbon domain-containing protein [Elusimicrobiota bacterium]
MKKIKFIVFLLCISILGFAEIICDRCGVLNPADSMFCQDCGARLVKSGKKSSQKNLSPQKEEKICPYCRVKNLTSANFCQNCGTKLTEVKEKEIISYSKKDSKFTKAILFSVLFPGVGHIYLAEKHEKTKGIILASSSAGLLLGSFVMWNYAESRYKEYEKTNDDFAYDDYSTSIDVANFLLVLFGCVWIYNVVDIYITTSKISKFSFFKNNDLKLSFDISPNKFSIYITRRI